MLVLLGQNNRPDRGGPHLQTMRSQSSCWVLFWACAFSLSISRIGTCWIRNQAPSESFSWCSTSMLVIQVSISYLFTLSPPARNHYQSISRPVITLNALQAIFLSLLASAHVDAGVSNFNPLHFNPHAVRLAPVSSPQQSRGLILDLLFGGSRGQGTTPRPVRRPGDRQDQAPSQELTGTWILGRHMITNS